MHVGFDSNPVAVRGGLGGARALAGAFHARRRERLGRPRVPALDTAHEAAAAGEQASLLLQRLAAELDLPELVVDPVGEIGRLDSLRGRKLSSLPRATCEIQGYVYDAKVRGARLARQFWGDPLLAERLEQQAAALRQQFNDDFWLPERQFFALALDGEKRPVDSLTSNIGHLL